MKLLALLLLVTPALAAAQTPPTLCTPHQVAVGFVHLTGDMADGDRSGVLLVLRNYSDQTCTLPGRPDITYLDDNQKPLAIKLQVPPGMHPGPVIVPLTLTPGTSVSSTLRWVPDLDDPARECAYASYAQLTLGGELLTLPLIFRAKFCGPAGKPAPYLQTILQRIPPSKPE